ncbi:hypothetical protein [Prevotella sp. HJM029]|uniref:hypothetical protein n=1 Tax=Prevotella sp. HJM029 TaxID=1433844 RepID=UPI00048C6654|nr:hypothetical protein [Prevotella sp. HJM029]
MHNPFPNETNHPHAICPNNINRPYPSPPNHAVCPYRAAVILLIAQGWQVQRSLPLVTEASEGATHNVGCTFFRHKLTMLRHAQSIPKRNQPSTRNLPKQHQPPLPISIKPCGVPIPIAVILLIAQGWQVQRSLPWVTDASAGATHNVGCTFFRHKLTMLRHMLTMLRHAQSTQTKRVNNLLTTQIGGGNASRTPAPSTLNEFRF